MCGWDTPNPDCRRSGEKRRRGGILSLTSRWGLAPPPPPSPVRPIAQPGRFLPIEERAGGRGSSSALSFLSLSSTALDVIIIIILYLFIHISPNLLPPTTNIAIFRAVSRFSEPFRHFQLDFDTAATQPPRGPHLHPYFVCARACVRIFSRVLLFLPLFQPDSEQPSRRFPPFPFPPTERTGFGHLLTT